MEENAAKPPVKKRTTISNLILHLHPVRVPGESIRFSHTFGLGGMAALLIVLQVFTGFLLRFQYSPSVDNAYNSLEYLQNHTFFGQLIRNAHHWSGQLLVVIVFLHLARTVMMNAYFPPRRSNWLIGLALFILVLLMNFTGYLLPWDQLSYWAVTVVSSMLDYIPFIGSPLKYQILGGHNVGQNTLLNFYNFHTGILPAVLVLLMAYHFWKVRKAGGVILPANDEKQMVPSIPDLVMKELVTGLVLLAFIFLFSLIADAGLQERANPAVSPNPAKAPWYFLGVQELIVHLHPFFAVFLVPSGLLVLLIWLPFTRKQPASQGKWFSGENSKKTLKRVLIFTVILIPLWIIASESFLKFGQWLPQLPLSVSEGVIPFLVFTGIIYFTGRYLLNKYRLPFEVMVAAGFVFISAAYIIMMVTSLVFRGPGMKLVFPF